MPYSIFFSNKEVDARLRVIAVWGSYNRILDEEKMNETIESYKKYPEYMRPKQSEKEPMFILDWEFNS